MHRRFREFSDHELGAIAVALGTTEHLSDFPTLVDLLDEVRSEGITRKQPPQENEWVLVTYKSNWADEMNVLGHAIFTAKGWHDYVEEVRAYFTRGNNLSHSIGSNQWIEYESFDEWYRCYKTKSITQQEKDLLDRLSLELDKKFFYPEDLEEDLD